MGVETEKYKGWTVNLAKDLTSEHYELYDKFLSNHQEYDKYGDGYGKGWETYMQGKVKLIVDGMCGEFARLVYIERYHDDVCDDGNLEPYLELKSKELTNEIYDQLNTAYKKLYDKELNREDVQYAIWYRWT